MSDDSSVGHPEQQPSSVFGAAVDAYFNLNPEKFGHMPTAEFLDRAKEYLSVNESYENAKRTLLDLEEKKNQLEDEARSPAGQAAEQPLEQAIKNQKEHAAEEAPREDQPAEQQPSEHVEEQHDEPAENHSEEHNESHEEPNSHESHDQPAEQPTENQDQPSPDESQGDRPQISRAEINIPGGPAL